MVGTRYIGIGEEATYGTEVAATNYLKGASTEEFETKLDNIIIDSMTYLTHEDAAAGKKHSEGGFTAPVTAENGIGWLLKWALGNLTTTQPDATNSPSVYLHTILPANTVKSFTSRIGRDDEEIPYAGQLIKSIEITGKIDELVIVKITTVGKGEGASGSLNTPTYTTTRYLKFTDSAITIGGTDYTGKVSSIDIKIDNKFNTDKAYALGNAEFQVQPVLEGREVTGTIDLIDKDGTIKTAFLNTTKAAIVVTFTGDAIDASYNEYLKITIPAAVYDSYKDSVDKTTQVAPSVPFKAVYDATTTGEIKAELENTVTSY